MYDAVADDYCYPGTTVLKNKLDLRDAAELADFEAEVSDARADEEVPGGDPRSGRNLPMGRRERGRTGRHRDPEAVKPAWFLIPSPFARPLRAQTFR